MLAQEARNTDTDFILKCLPTPFNLFIQGALNAQVLKEWNNAICSNMHEPRDGHTEWSKSDRERQIPWDITYVWNVKYDTNELIYEAETDSQRQRTDLCLSRGAEVREGRSGVWG